MAKAEQQTTSTQKYGTVVVACNCKSVYQDAKYGRGRRVHNLAKKGVPRCTVCKAEKTPG